MNRAFWLRISFVLALSVALVALPESSFAQRGGSHGGGGGFHSGGGGFHGGGGGFHGGGGSGFHSGGGFGGSHGGGGFGGFRNGGFGGFRGGRGFGGFRGDGDFDDFFRGYGGYPFFANFDFGFGFWPYWGGYPYWYRYGPGWGPYGYYSPYDYPDYPYDASPDRYRGNDRRDRDNRCRPDYRHPDNGCNDGSPDTSRPSGESPSAKPSNTFEPEVSPDRSYVTTNFADYRPAASSSNDSPSNGRSTQATITATTAVTSNYQLANSTTQQLPSRVRPAVRNVIQALRAMPPDARERQLNSGRYDSFSPEERELLNNASQSPQAE